MLVYALMIALLDGTRLAGWILGDTAYVISIALAAAATITIASRASGPHRYFWRFVAASSVAWLAGELALDGYEPITGHPVPFPSVADALYLSSYALVIPAVIVGFGSRQGIRIGRALLDASILVAATGLAAWELLLSPQLEGGVTFAAAVGAAYPLMDVAILTVVTTLIFLNHKRVPPSVWLVAAGLVACGTVDVLYTYGVVLHPIVPDIWLRLGWEAEAVLFVVAAVVAMRQPSVSAVDKPRTGDVGILLILSGVAATLLVVGLDLLDGVLQPEVAVIGVYTLALLITRLVVASVEQRHVAELLREALAAQERLAVTDGLTNLHNRRFFEEVIRLEAERAGRRGGAFGLLVVDVDHFKWINDRHGHQVGDDVLRELARRLSESVRPSDLVARYGGEEFVILATDVVGEADLRALAERCRMAIGSRPFATASGSEISVTVSVGVAEWPTHAQTIDELIRTADRALYAAKTLGRNQVQLGAPAESFMEAGAESEILTFLYRLADEIDLRMGGVAHSSAVAVLADAVAIELDLDWQGRWRLALAARLHDIGKVSVPDAILRKAGSLTEEEWVIIREHPEHGATILSLAPDLADVAPIVLAHHERPDGRGYPNGLTSAEIPIESAILAVCDSWHAMRSLRPYDQAKTAAEAIDELRREAGRQFDPRVVEAFLSLRLDTLPPDPGRATRTGELA